MDRTPGYAHLKICHWTFRTSFNPSGPSEKIENPLAAHPGPDKSGKS
jgi:hypothetical protein